MNQNPFEVYEQTVLLKKALQKVPTKRLLKLLAKIRFAKMQYYSTCRITTINFIRVKQELAKREHVE